MATSTANRDASHRGTALFAPLPSLLELASRVPLSIHKQPVPPEICVAFQSGTDTGGRLKNFHSLSPPPQPRREEGKAYMYQGVSESRRPVTFPSPRCILRPRLRNFDTLICRPSIL